MTSCKKKAKQNTLSYKQTKNKFTIQPNSPSLVNVFLYLEEEQISKSENINLNYWPGLKSSSIIITIIVHFTVKCSKRLKPG